MTLPLELLTERIGAPVAWVSRQNLDDAGPVLMLATVEDAVAVVAAADTGAALVELDVAGVQGLAGALLQWLADGWRELPMPNLPDVPEFELQKGTD